MDAKWIAKNEGQYDTVNEYVVVCPECRSRNITAIDSRPAHYGVRRRKRCSDCNAKFTTCEISMEDLEAIKELIFTKTLLTNIRYMKDNLRAISQVVEGFYGEKIDDSNVN